MADKNVPGKPSSIDPSLQDPEDQAPEEQPAACEPETIGPQLFEALRNHRVWERFT